MYFCGVLGWLSLTPQQRSVVLVTGSIDLHLGTNMPGLTFDLSLLWEATKLSSLYLR